jgi:hypothetical protein
MCATIIPFATAEDLFQSPVKRKCLPETSKKTATEAGRISETETRLWKITGAQSSRAEAITEWLVLGLFLLVAAVLVAACLAELSFLMQSDAVGHLAGQATEHGR